jgi:hypothetical protein
MAVCLILPHATVMNLTKTLESRRRSTVPNVADQIPATELDSKNRPNSDNGDAVTPRPQKHQRLTDSTDDE